MITVTPLSSVPKHHFYGYYGIDAWDPSIRYHLSLETDFHEHRPAVGDVASVGIDRQRNPYVYSIRIHQRLQSAARKYDALD